MLPFLQIAEVHPKFVRGALAQVLDTMMTIAEADSLEESTRKLAAEFVVTLCEAREQAPGMMRKLPQLNHRLFMCLMNYLLDMEVHHPPPEESLADFPRLHRPHYPVVLIISILLPPVRFQARTLRYLGAPLEEPNYLREVG